LSTSDVSFDWGNGHVTISFAKQKSGGAGLSLAGDSSPPGGASAPLEIRGTIDDTSVTGGVISGPISGNHSVFLSRTGPNLFTTQDHFNYQAQISRSSLTGDLNPNAELNLKRLSTQHPALKISDLPSLAAFDASVRFANIGVVPEVATDVIYDPILGFMEFQFGPNSLMRLEGIYLTKDALSMSLDSWKPKSTFAGSIVQGASVYGHVLVGSSFPGLGLADSQLMGELPPKYYSGTYKGIGPNALTFSAIGYLEYNNARGTNSAEYPFLYYPKFNLKIFVCDGSRTFMEFNYDMEAMDQIQNVARLHDAASRDRKLLDITYTPDWKNISGKFTKDNTDGPIDVKDPQLNFQAKNLTEFTCAANHLN
jgi:hypothetical protein